MWLQELCHTRGFHLAVHKHTHCAEKFDLCSLGVSTNKSGVIWIYFCFSASGIHRKHKHFLIIGFIALLCSDAQIFTQTCI